MKAVILGAGFAGRSHAAALRAAGVEIAAVITSRDETARAFAAQWNIPATCVNKVSWLQDKFNCQDGWPIHPTQKD